MWTHSKVKAIPTLRGYEFICPACSTHIKAQYKLELYEVETIPQGHHSPATVNKNKARCFQLVGHPMGQQFAYLEPISVKGCGRTWAEAILYVEDDDDIEVMDA